MVRPTNSLLNNFSKHGGVAHFNTQIREAINNGKSHKALQFYRQIKQTGLTPDKYTFPFVAKACAKISDLIPSLIIHAHILKSPFWSDIFVGTSVIDMYVKCDRIECARKVFDEMPERDVTMWNAMLLGFVRSSFVCDFFVYFKGMRMQGCVPDSVTIIGLIQSVTELLDVNLVKGAHGFGYRVGMMNDVSVVNTVISGYCKCRDLISAESVFDSFPSKWKTIVSWNSLIAGYSLTGNCYGTFSLYWFLLFNGVHKPDVSTFLSLLSSCVTHDALPYGKLIHSHVTQLGCDQDVSVANTLLTMYSKCGDIDSALNLFRTMTNKTRVTWTAMIGGYAAKGSVDEAYSLFRDMQAEGEKPDDVTLVSLLSGCSQTGSLALGERLDEYAFTNGLRGSVLVCNAIIDMYAKCGNVDKGKELFHSMPSKTIVSWTTLISGLAMNGKFTEALELFYKMIELCLKPNHITCLTILQACTHAGFLDKGMECFELMTKVYNINPSLEHYSCMVDLLGRKGKLKEALELIESMPFSPDAAIWGTLLGTCKIHRNVEIGEYAANHLYKLEPQAAVSYVEMANMYASVGRWDGVSKVRALMKYNKVKKYPGQSLIQVDSKKHIFGVEERFHPEGLQIYDVLDLLTSQLKEDGVSCLTEDLPEHEIE